MSGFVKKLGLTVILSIPMFLSCQTEPVAQNVPSSKQISEQTRQATTTKPTLEEQIQNVELAKVLIRNQSRKVYGSGCVYMKKDGYYYIATNQHVAQGEDDAIENKKLFIVDTSDDAFEEDDIPLEVVVASKTKDVAVVKAKVEDVEKYNKLRDEYNAKAKQKKKKIELFKGEIGDSDKVDVLDKIIVAGYPLTISGITIGYASNVSHTDSGVLYGWDHECFIVSTPISPGNSGSGAYLLKNDKLYLIGLVHACFRDGQNMNLVIKVNEFKDILYTFKNPDDPSEDEFKKVSKTAEQGNTLERLFEITGATVVLDKSADGLKFVFYTGDFPTDIGRRIEIIDGEKNGYGADKIIFADGEKTKEYEIAKLPEELQVKARNLYNRTAKNLAITIDYKNLLNKKSKELLFEHEQMEKVKFKRELFSADYHTVWEEFETKLEEYLKNNKETTLF